jgi:hypothetical protein
MADYLDDDSYEDEYQAPKRSPKRRKKAARQRPAEDYNDIRDEDEWSPPRDVRTHAGTRIDRNSEFFEPPPSDLGEVLTAWSTLKYSTKEKSLGARLGITVGCIFAVTAIFLVVGIVVKDVSMVGVMGFMIACILSPFFFLAIGFKHTVSYVCENGVAKITLKGGRQGQLTEEIFVFADALDLIAREVRQYVNGIYSGTTYNYDWNDEHGNRVFRLKGTYKDNKKGGPKEKDPYHLAKSAETAWSQNLLAALQDEFDEHGNVEFKVNKKDTVRVGAGYFVFNFKGKKTRVKSDDIKLLTISEGQFQIHTYDAKWFGSKGKFHFEYGAMANAHVFLLAVEELAGFTFGEE